MSLNQKWKWAFWETGGGTKGGVNHHEGNKEIKFLNFNKLSTLIPTKE